MNESVQSPIERLKEFPVGRALVHYVHNNSIVTYTFRCS